MGASDWDLMARSGSFGPGIWDNFSVDLDLRNGQKIGENETLENQKKSEISEKWLFNWEFTVKKVANLQNKGTYLCFVISHFFH